MARPLGSAFAPIAANDEETKKLPPAQQAIQVLSMRIPRVRGARSISPLVGEPGSAARRQIGGFSPESAILQTLMQTMAPGASPSVPSGSLPGAASQSLGARNPMGAAMTALGGNLSAPSPFQGQQPGGSSASLSGVLSGPPPPVFVPGLEDSRKPGRQIDPPPPPPPSLSAAIPPREIPERIPMTPDPRIPMDDTGAGRDPRAPRPRPAPPPIVIPPPPQGRVPNTPRDPNAPPDILPPPSDWGPDTGVPPATPPIDPRVILEALAALVGRGGRGF